MAKSYLSILKSVSQRSDIVVVGAGLSGICAALSAAREGAVVNLIESRLTVGGKIGQDFLSPYDFEGTTEYIYKRETGILDEIMHFIYSENLEGNYAGQERALRNLISKEERLNLFMDTHLFSVNLTERKDEIESVISFSNSLESKIIFRAKYFVDCTGKGILGQFAEVPGEKGINIREYEESSASSKSFQFRLATSMEVAISDSPKSFRCPNWVPFRWEDNHKSAQIDLLESLNRNVEGIHNVEWLGNVKNEPDINSAVLVWSAWDYLKNRSALKDAAKNWIVRNFSPHCVNSDIFRCFGHYTLEPEDLESGKQFYDCVAMGRGPIDMNDSLLLSPRGKVSLARPFEIPLRSLISKHIKNLFLTGVQASVTSRVSSSMSHPPTASQTGSAVGVAAALCIKKKILPKTLLKKERIGALQHRLSRLNQSFSFNIFEDQDNLIPRSRVNSSSYLKESLLESQIDEKICFEKALIQFSTITDKIDEIFLLLESDHELELEYRILEGANGGNTIPGHCLFTSSIKISSGAARWERFPVAVTIRSKGWHYLEILNAKGINFYKMKNSPVGSCLFLPLKNFRSGLINPYSQYSPFLPDEPNLSESIAMQISPRQELYFPENVKNGKSRPDSLPNLWISDETDFRYPEFLEFHWDEKVEISSIDIVWDSTLEFLYPSRPKSLGKPVIPSIVRDYKVYYKDENEHWHEFICVNGNEKGFCSHHFQPILTHGIEIEILMTNGLNRAQVYEVRAY